jgi:DNA-binding transcriptional LysR family regulator
VTFDQLEMLEMIVQKGSFKAASEALYKSQPSLSVAIKKLEEEFGILLFNRDDYRPKLTDEGRVFFARAKQTLASFRLLDTVAKELGKKIAEPTLTVVVDPLARYEAIEGIFEECLGQPVPTELTLRSEILGVGMEAVLSGEADFAIAPKLENHDEIESHLFDRVTMIPVVAKKSIELSDLGDIEHFRRRPQIFVLQNRGQKSEARRATQPTVSEGQMCFVTDHAMKTKLIKEGFGWGRLALHEIADDLKRGRLLKVKPSVAQPVTFDLHFMRCRRKPLGPVARKVWERLQANAIKK